MALVFFSHAAAALGAWGVVPPPPWLKELARAPVPEFPFSPRGVVLLDFTQTTVADGGAITTRHRRVYKILTTAGRDLAYESVYYDSQTQITDFHAWAITKSGEEYSLKEKDAMETSAFGSMLYADDRMKVVRIPAAEPGNVVAFEYEQQARPYMLQTSWSFQGEDPVVRAQYVLTLPQDWTHKEQWYNAAAAAPQKTGAGSTVWEVLNVPAIKGEPSMPSWRAVAGRMAINLLGPSPNGRHETWSDVGRWYGQLAASRRMATPALQAKTRELIAGKATPLERIKALTAFAQRDIRYVAIEIGVGGYQPHAAGDIFTNRFGDCKDKVTVLGTMLRDAGVESYDVLVHTSRDFVDRDFPTMSAFNHVIAAIRLPDGVAPSPDYAVVKHPRLGRLLLFDPTSTHTRFGYLPSYLQESRGLLVTGDGGELIDLPVHPAAANHLAIAGQMTLDGEGTLQGELVETRTGWPASEWRSNLETMSGADRKKYLEERLAVSFSQQTIRDLSIENVDDLEKDLVIRYKVTAPGYARKAAGMMLVRPRVVGYPTSGLDLRERKYAYETEGPYVETEDVTIALPAGLAADELPEVQSFSNGMMKYASESKVDGGVLRYGRTLEMSPFRVPLAKLVELNTMLKIVAADERKSVVLK